MSRQKKNRSSDKAIQKLIAATAILNLINALIELIESLIGYGEGAQSPFPLPPG